MSHINSTPRLPTFMLGFQHQAAAVISPAFSGELRAQSGRLRVAPAEGASAGEPPSPASSIPEEILLHQSLATSPVVAAPPPAPAPVIDMSRMDAAIERLRLTSERLASDVRADALEVAMLLARKIVEGEVTTNVDKMMGMVRSAVRRLGESRRVTIRLCPADADLLTNGGKRTPEDVAGLSAAKVEVVSDPTLSRGDCQVEGELGSVDGRLDTRFAELRRAIVAESNEGDQA
jgi:flagellar assembly protein FliH